MSVWTTQEVLEMRARGAETWAAICEAERDAALAELADIKASYRATVDEPCDAGQVHCTCVPALRAEVERMRPVVEAACDWRDGEEWATADALTESVDTFRASAQKEGAVPEGYNIADALDDAQKEGE